MRATGDAIVVAMPYGIFVRPAASVEVGAFVDFVIATIANVGLGLPRRLTWEAENRSDSDDRPGSTRAATDGGARALHRSSTAHSQSLDSRKSAMISVFAFLSPRGCSCRMARTIAPRL